MPEQSKPPFGFLIIDKPPGLTSHDVVARARRGLSIKKVGHAGTLDPLATGVLVLCLGAATRLSEYVMAAAKQYRARVRLGATTDTYDATGQIIERRDAQHISEQNTRDALEQFRGTIEQIPPMYSAIKQGGRKLYELARAGETVGRPARTVTIETLSLSEWKSPEFTLEVTCSSGTYIRSLAHDLGEALGVGAHLTALTRIASGHFTLGDAVELDAVLQDSNWQQHIIAPQIALADWRLVVLDETDVEHILHGRAVPAGDIQDGALAQAQDAAGALLAIVEAQESQWRPRKVFPRG